MGSLAHQSSGSPASHPPCGAASLRLDLARRRDDEWMIIELGDGQVSDCRESKTPSDSMKLYHWLGPTARRGVGAMIRTFRNEDRHEWLRMRRALVGGLP